MARPRRLGMRHPVSTGKRVEQRCRKVKGSTHLTPAAAWLLLLWQLALSALSMVMENRFVKHQVGGIPPVTVA